MELLQGASQELSKPSESLWSGIITHLDIQ